MKTDSNEWEMVTGLNMFMDTMSKALYRDRIACLWELIRNALCACMPSEDQWNPSSTYVELWLTRDHPLAPKSWATVCLDKGSGFTEPKIKKFCNLGGDDPEPMGTHSGAAQKQIGRLAYFALNRRITVERKPDSGFFILTRTSSSGPVSLIEITPYKLRFGGIIPRQLPPDASELWKFKNIKGSFTAIVIPNSVIENSNEIREALQWYLPRRKNKAVKILVDGKPLEAPPLASQTVSHDGIEAYLEKVGTPIMGKTGLWLTDAETGLRCAFCPDMGGYVPDPLARSDLDGDIFIPGLLKQQHPSRIGLNPNFLKSPTWKKEIFLVLYRKVAPFAKELIGNALYIDASEPNGRRLKDFSDMFETAWGLPSIKGSDLTRDTSGPIRRRPPRINRPVGPGGGNPPPSGNTRPPNGGSGDGEGDGTRTRGLAWRIGDREYYVQNMPSAAVLVYAEVSESGEMITINPDYTFQGLSRLIMDEHCLQHVLNAVARHILPHDTGNALVTAEQFRRELQDALKKHR